MSVSSVAAGILTAVDTRTGRVVWTASSIYDPPDRGPILSPAAIWRDRVIVRTLGGLTAYRRADGSFVWNSHFDAEAARVLAPSAPPAVTEAAIYFGPDLGTACAFDPASGRRLWRFRSDGLQSQSDGFVEKSSVSLAYCAPVVCGDRVVMSDGAGFTYALSARTGKCVWKQRTSPAWGLSGDEGDVYAATTNGLYLLNWDTGKTLRFRPMRLGAMGLVVSGHRALVVGDMEAHPGWEVMDLRDWTCKWRDPTGVVCGVPHVSGQFVVVGVWRPRATPGSAEAPRSVRMYRGIGSVPERR